ncbi:MAG: sucrase ferredoxin [Chloroflexota bacterium]
MFSDESVLTKGSLKLREIWFEEYQRTGKFPHRPLLIAPNKVPNGDQIRDIMVCTHGTVDVACARFGIPVFKKLEKKYGSDQLRIWRVSRFGGHLFAPTLMDFPTGDYWAYVEEKQAAQIIERHGDPAALRGHYRGWAALPLGHAHAAERNMW